MSAFFDYPSAAAFGRVLPKSKVYGYAKASKKLRQLFVDQVDQIVWAYKLAPETINLDATKAVAEIQIFRISLRTAELDECILRAIDKAVAFPIIFELNHSGKSKVTAAFKRPSEADSTKWVVSEYFDSDWEPGDREREALPSSLNLAKLYEQLLGELLPDCACVDGPIEVRVERVEAVRSKQREVNRIKARLAREKQFNKKVAINAELRAVTNELKSLGVSLATED